MSQKLQIDNTQPTEDLFRYKRSEFCESLFRRELEIRSMQQSMTQSQSRVESIESFIELPQQLASSSVPATSSATLIQSSVSSSAETPVPKMSSNCNSQEAQIKELQEQLARTTSMLENLTQGNQWNAQPWWGNSWHSRH